MLLSQLAKIPSHPEHGCKPVGDVCLNELRDPGQIPALIADIKANGIKEPLIVDEMESGERIFGNGHHRFFAARELGLKEVPVTIRHAE